MNAPNPLHEDQTVRLLDSIDKRMQDMLKVLKNQNDMLKEVHAAATSPEDRLLIKEWNENTKRIADCLESTRTKIHKTMGNVVIKIKVRTLLTWSWCARKVRSIKRPHINLRPRREDTPTSVPVAA